jgi:hypothetical protein
MDSIVSKEVMLARPLNFMLWKSTMKCILQIDDLLDTIEGIVPLATSSRSSDSLLGTNGDGKSSANTEPISFAADRELIVVLELKIHIKDEVDLAKA